MRQKQGVFSLFLLSPSSRRAWIEITLQIAVFARPHVALLAEGVDRNTGCCRGGLSWGVALLAEGVDRNICPFLRQVLDHGSPSSRRAWIEIVL